MPWRELPTPYRVWVSEIMLQQTQIATVKGYFTRFLERFPTIEALASAPLEDVLKMWEGLGYYSRARNLQRAAQVVVDEYGGELPQTAKALASLPGIGDYTAAAIASICHREAVAVVDGNVARVCARLMLLKDDFSKLPLRRKLSAGLSKAISSSGNPGFFNQAMMELGETLCLPRTARCEVCPLADQCRAKAKGVQDRYPIPRKRAIVPIRREVAVIVGDEACVALTKREARGLLGGLYELPTVVAGEEWQERFGRAHFPIRAPQKIGRVRHQFSHFTLELEVYRAEGVCERQAWREKPVATAHRKALQLVRGS